jgi:hypothetical protein
VIYLIKTNLIFSILFKTPIDQPFLYFIIPMTKVWGKVMAAKNEKKEA